MNNQIVIRLGRPSDIPDVMKLVRELAEYERAPNEVTNTEEMMLRDGFGEHPAFGFYIAEMGGEVVGIALYYTRYSTWKGRSLYLEDIVVTEEHRGKGIGHELFVRSIKHALDGGFAAMNWQVLDWNTPAIRFYDRYKAEKDYEWINCRISCDRFDSIISSAQQNKL